MSSISRTAFDRIVEALSSHGVRVHGNQARSCCPAHGGDNTGTLSVRRFPDRARVTCFKGCHDEDVLAALGMTVVDLFDTPKGSEYVYQDATGRPSRTVHRPPDKGGIRQHFHDAEKPVLLYRLPLVHEAVRLGAEVWLVEGEADVEALEDESEGGIIATTAPQGADGVKKVDFSPLKGARVRAVVDRDAKGDDWARTVRDALDGVAESVTFVQARAGKDVSDHLTRGHTVDELVPYRFDDDPIDLVPPRQAAEFPAYALPAALGMFAAEVAEATQTPIDMAGCGVLASVATLAAGRIVVEPKRGWVEPTNLYTVTAMDPGSRKSAVVAEVTDPIVQIEKRKREEAAPRRAEDEAQFRVLEKRRAFLEGNAAKAIAAKDRQEADEKVQAVARELAATKVAPLPQLFTDDATSEAMSALLSEHGRMAVLSAEGGLFDTIAGRYSNGIANVDIWLKGHSGDRAKVDRIGRPSEYVESPAITLFLAVQPYVVGSLFGRGEFQGRGLLARVLWSLPPSNVGYRKIDSEPVSNLTREAYADTLAAVDKLAEQQDPDDPLVLRFDAEAAPVFRKFATWVEHEQRNGGKLRPIREWASKLAGAVARLAALHHLADQCTPEHMRDNGGMTPDRQINLIGLDSIDAATALGHYFVEHALHAHGGAPTKEVDQAVHVLARIDQALERGKGATGGLGDTFTARDVHRLVMGDSRFRRMDDLTPALKVLEEHNQLRKVADGTHDGPGRSKSPTYRRAKRPNPLAEPGSVNSVNSVNGVAAPNDDEEAA